MFKKPAQNLSGAFKCPTPSLFRDLFFSHLGRKENQLPGCDEKCAVGEPSPLHSCDWLDSELNEFFQVHKLLQPTLDALTTDHLFLDHLLS